MVAESVGAPRDPKMDIKELIEMIKNNTAAQEEETKKMERQTQELLLQKWKPPLPEPRGEEPPLPEPRGEEPPLPEPRGEEPPLPEPRGEEPPLPEPRGEGAKSIPPPQPRPPPLWSSLAPLHPVPRPLLLDTLSVGLDLPSLDLEPRSRQKQSQFSTWSPALLLPDTKTSLHRSQTSLTLPLVTASLPLGDRTSQHWVPVADLCPLLQPPVPRLSFVAPVEPLGSLVAGAWSLPGWAGTWTDPPSSPPVEEGEN
ncbi:UNVERIFIED_CONTAM: hypothetical protein FKN15_032983 [Acipenser sinensis]